MVAITYPFTWQHTYIPVLPPAMVDIVCSPTPFLIGLLTSSLPLLRELPLEEVSSWDVPVPSRGGRGQREVPRGCLCSLPMGDRGRCCLRLCDKQCQGSRGPHSFIYEIATPPPSLQIGPLSYQ